MALADPQRLLLLLPPAPLPPTFTPIKSAFGDPIRQVLKEAADRSSESSKAAILEIALACPHLVSSENVARSTLYAETQSILASVYRLICIIAAQENVNVEDQDGVDVRILLVSWSSDTHVAGSSVTAELPYGPVVSLQTLARSGRSWQQAFVVDSKEGEALAKAFIASKGTDDTITRVQGGSAKQTNKADSDADTRSAGGLPSQHRNVTQGDLHRHVAVGGTFDHIHIGHKLLLTMTVFACDQNAQDHTSQRSATIGITGDQLLKNKKHAEVLESWEDRYKSVMTFVNAIVDFSPPASSGQRHVSIRDDPGPNGKSMDVSYPNGLVIKCTEIQDAFGPTITEERISVLIISGETRSGGKAVNDKREEKGWQALDVFEVDVLDAEDDGGNGKVKEDFGSKLSSTAIREKLARKRQSSL